MAGDLHKALAASHVGFSFFGIVGGSFYLGYLADEHFGTSPLWALIGFACGFGLGFYELIRGMDRKPSRAKSEDKTKEDKAEDPRPPA